MARIVDPFHISESEFPSLKISIFEHKLCAMTTVCLIGPIFEALCQRFVERDFSLWFLLRDLDLDKCETFWKLTHVFFNLSAWNCLKYINIDWNLRWAYVQAHMRLKCDSFCFVTNAYQHCILIVCWQYECIAFDCG